MSSSLALQPQAGLSGAVDAGLRARARRVIPGGLWGHLNAANLPPGYPQFFTGAEGCRLRAAAWDTTSDAACVAQMWRVMAEAGHPLAFKPRDG